MITLIFLLLLQDRPTRVYRGSSNNDPELIAYRKDFIGDVKLDKNGQATVTFAPFVLRFPPSCTIANKTNPKRGIAYEHPESKEFLTIKGKKGDLAHYECKAVLMGK